jgi:undecaprenyl diphosphate synthase
MDTNNQIPQHIAIVMDGNRRWAKAHGLPVLEGHRKVSDEILEPLVEYAAKRGVKYLTFWAWSTENWRREQTEVFGIMNLFRNVIKNRWERLHKKGVRIQVIGDLSQFAPDIRQSLTDVVSQTKDNTTITTVFALNYGGRDEIIRAANKAVSTGSELTVETLSAFLDTADIPDPELVVRTGGEQRLSGFLPWQSVYSELYFPSWYMPEFTPEKFDEVLAWYGTRSRRFGK